MELANAYPLCLLLLRV